MKIDQMQVRRWSFMKMTLCLEQYDNANNVRYKQEYIRRQRLNHKV